MYLLHVFFYVNIVISKLQVQNKVILSQIGLDDHNACDCFQTKSTARGSGLPLYLHLPRATAVLKIDIIIPLSGIVEHLTS